jgi:hypothetical protein
MLVERSASHSHICHKANMFGAAAAGKQSAYLEFHFGDRVHTTDVLKSTGKFATWETPVQLTGAGITMKVLRSPCLAVV